MTVDKAFYRHYLEMLLTLNRIHALTPCLLYTSNYIRPGKPTRLFLEEKLKERSRMQNESISLSPYET